MFSDTSSLVITLNHNTPHDVATALEIATAGKNAGLKVSVVDLSRVTSRGKTQVFEMNLRRFIWRSSVSPINKLKDICRKTEIDFYQIPTRISKDIKQQATEIAKSIPESLSKLESWEIFDGHLGPSLTSHLVTLVSMDEDLDPRRYRGELNEQVANFLHIREYIFSLLEKSTNPTISVFNGRLPSMAAAVVAGKETGSRVLWHEIAKTRDYFFLEDFSPHDRLKMQEAMLQFSETFSEDTKREIWSNFMELRRVDSATNKFLSFQKLSAEKRVNVIPKSALILTSSPDETVGIGKSWSGVEWKNQYEALNYAYRRLTELGFDITVRLHPNITTKSWAEYFRGINSFREFRSNVVLPSDYVSTYELIDASSLVLVWRSTTGLEANAAGKPTFCMGLTRYDLTADVTTIHSKEVLMNCFFEEYEVDTSKAMAGILWSTFAARRASSTEYKQFISDCHNFLRYEKRVLQLLYFIAPLTLITKALNGPRIPIKILFAIVGKRHGAAILRRLHNYGELNSVEIHSKNQLGNLWQ